MTRLTRCASSVVAIVSLLLGSAAGQAGTIINMDFQESAVFGFPADPPNGTTFTGAGVIGIASLTWNAIDGTNIGTMAAPIIQITGTDSNLDDCGLLRLATGKHASNQRLAAQNLARSDSFANFSRICPQR